MTAQCHCLRPSVIVNTRLLSFCELYSDQANKLAVVIVTPAYWSESCNRVFHSLGCVPITVHNVLLRYVQRVA